jgi:hypothetical protein
MDAAYGQVYRALYERHWWWRAREAFILQELVRVRRPDDRRALLDIGCGDGLLLGKLEAFGPAFGIEPEAALVRPDGPLRDRIHVGYLDESYRPPLPVSTVLMLDVLEHIPDAARILRRVHAMLPTDGALDLTVPALRLLWTGHDEINQHVTRYSRRTLVETLVAGGFQVERMRYFFRWLVLPKLAVRALETVRRPRPTPPSIPPAPVNLACYALSRVEQRLLGGMFQGSLPLPGSSLLAIARPG